MCRAAPGRIAGRLPTLQSPRRGTGKRAPRFGLRAVDRFRFSPPRVSGLCIIETTASRGQCNRLKRRIAIARRIRNRFNRSSHIGLHNVRWGQKRKCARSRGMSVRPSGADIVRLHAQVVPFAIFCKMQHIIRSSGRRWHRGPYPRPIAEVSSGSAINITPDVIDHGHRPRPHRRCCSCLIISRGVTTGCAPGTPSIGPRWSGSIQRD